jgi:hypothetical protein
MFKVFDTISRIVGGCDESLRIMITTAVLMSMIMGGVVLHNYVGGLLTGAGAAIIGVSVIGVMIEDYQSQKAQNEQKETDSG